MKRTPILAIVLAAFAFSTTGVYAQEDKQDEKSPFPTDLIAQEDKQDEKSPFPADLIAQSDDKEEEKKPDLAS